MHYIEYEVNRKFPSLHSCASLYWREVTLIDRTGEEVNLFCLYGLDMLVMSTFCINIDTHSYVLHLLLAVILV